MHTYEKMDPQIKAWWVDALRSGEYEQGMSALKQRGVGPVEHCCLGVVCEVLAEHNHPLMSTISIADNRIEVRGTNEGVSNQNLTSILSDEIASELKLMQFATSSDRVESKQTLMWMLAQRNDAECDTHWSFDQIADWIEANL